MKKNSSDSSGSHHPARIPADQRLYFMEYSQRPCASLRGASVSVQRPSAPAQESEISGELVYSPYSKFHPKPLVDDLTIRVK